MILFHRDIQKTILVLSTFVPIEFNVHGKIHALSVLEAFGIRKMTCGLEREFISQIC